MMVSRVLLSPRVGALLDDEATRFVAGRLPELSEQPYRPIALPHGKARAWGIELEDEREDHRTYRALMVVEPDGRTLSILALDEQPALVASPESRATLPGWRSVAVNPAGF